MRAAGATLAALLLAPGCYDPPTVWPGGGDGGVPDGRATPDARTSCDLAYDLQYGGSHYRKGTMARAWYEAESDCEDDGGHLVVSDSGGENVFVRSRFLLGGDVWLGISDHRTETAFLPVTAGALPAAAPWAMGEPNNDQGREDCGAQRSDLRWNDGKCAEVMLEYLCECDLLPLPVPPTWCNTDQHDTCGTCGKKCGPTEMCIGQVCM